MGNTHLGVRLILMDTEFHALEMDEYNLLR